MYCIKNVERFSQDYVYKQNLGSKNPILKNLRFRHIFVLKILALNDTISKTALKGAICYEGRSQTY